MADDLAALDAARYHTLHPFLQRFAPNSFPDREGLNALAETLALRNAEGLPLRFDAPQEASAYEITVYRTGRVPTRPLNWHDLFNALAWCAFPRAKALLNALHVEESLKQGANPRRSRSRDALTLFDESGMVVACSDDRLAALLREFRWKDLFWARREAVLERMSFFIFGHAIHEQLLRPFDGITARAVILSVDESFHRRNKSEQLRAVDDLICGYFERAENWETPQKLQPLPVLGVPLWWPANASESYYDNTKYFRPKKQSPA